MNNSNREVNGRKNFIDNIRSLCVYSLFIWHAKVRCKGENIILFKAWTIYFMVSGRNVEFDR